MYMIETSKNTIQQNYQHQLFTFIHSLTASIPHRHNRLRIAVAHRDPELVHAKQGRQGHRKQQQQVHGLALARCRSRVVKDVVAQQRRRKVQQREQPCNQENATLFEFFLRKSRACLGKRIIIDRLYKKWTQSASFSPISMVDAAHTGYQGLKRNLRRETRLCLFSCSRMFFVPSVSWQMRSFSK